MSNSELRLETVDYEDYAKELIDGARALGSSPAHIALGYIRVGREMLDHIKKGY